MIADVCVVGFRVAYQVVVRALLHGCWLEPVLPGLELLVGAMCFVILGGMADRKGHLMVSDKRVS